MLSAYEAFVKKNEPIIGTLDDLARSLLLLVPGRYSRSELASETAHVLLNLLGFYHNQILGRPKSYSALLSIPSSTMTRNIENALIVIQNVEILLEMLSKRKLPDRSRWLVILLIESLKVSLRLALLYHNKGAMVMQSTPNESIRIVDAVDTAFTSNASTPFSDIIALYRKHGRSSINPHGIFTPPPVCIERVTPQQLASEILFIIRPVVYVAAVLKYSLRSWTPFMASLMTDVVSRILVGKMSGMSPRQRQEVHRRTFLWLFYLLRSPCFEKYTMIPLVKALSLCGNLPLIGVIFGNCLDLAESLQSHYFYTSTS